MSSHTGAPRVLGGLRSGILGFRALLGRHLSVRWKLTLWYAVMCAATLGLTGFAMRSVLDMRIQNSVDAGLHTTAQKMLRDLRQPDVAAVGPQALHRAFMSYRKKVKQALRAYSASASAPGQFEQVYLVDLAPSPEENPTHPLYSPVQPKGVLISSVQLMTAITHPVTTTIHLHGEPLRVYMVPIRPPTSLTGVALGVLVIFQEEHTYLQIERDVDRVVLLGIPLGVLVALVAGWWVARAALRPINRISRTVQAIGDSRDLSRRLDFVGPIDEVGRLAHTFDGMMDRLERAFETQKRFIADASHELRTPLTAIRGNAELYAMAPAEERDICVTSIRREAERMSRLVADLLLLAAADVDEQPVHLQLVALDDLVTDAYRSALILAGDRVTLRCGHVESVTVHGDPDRLKQLILNLLDNAIKFTPPGGTVTLSTVSEDGGARIAVADTGVGIPPEEQEAIFRRFYRVDEGRSRRGSGLGLSICAWIVAAHGGRIDVQSAPGQGSIFSVWLPSITSSAVATSR